MRVSTFIMCVLAVLTWSATGVLAQGKGKGRSDKAAVRERAAKPNQGQGNPQAEDVKAGKGGGKGGQVQKQTGPQGKKMEQASDAAEKGKGKGKGQQQQAQAFQKQLQHEQAKHMERQARLNRIRELAVKKGDAEMIARVDKLIAKEQEVYSRKLQQMQGQSRATQQLPPISEKSAKAPAGPNDVTARKTNVVTPGQKDKPTGVNQVKKQQKEAPAAGQEKEKK